MSCKKPCKECPWANTNQHSIKFRTYAEKMSNLGKIKNHKCHMVSNDVWGYKSKIDSSNVCIGHQNFTQEK